VKSENKPQHAQPLRLLIGNYEEPKHDSVFYQQDAAKRQTAGIKFTHSSKIRFFARQGRLVAPIQVKLCRADVHMGPLSVQNFTSVDAGSCECGPEISTISTFGKESPHRGEPLDRFLKFCTPN